MPTFYTDKPGSFREFALKCLKAFELYDQTIYLEEKVTEARDKLYGLIHMDDEEIDFEGVWFGLQEDLRFRSQTDEMAVLKETYEDLLSEAREWPGPEEVKNFMIEQLETSIKYDIYTPLPPTTYSYEAAVKNAADNFLYRLEAYNKHVAALNKYSKLVNEAKDAL